MPRRQAIRHARSRRGHWHKESHASLARGSNHRQWSRDDECLVSASGRGEREKSVEGTCSGSLNRRMRTRMLRGVRDAVSYGGGNPIVHNSEYQNMWRFILAVRYFMPVCSCNASRTFDSFLREMFPVKAMCSSLATIFFGSNTESPIIETSSHSRN